MSPLPSSAENVSDTRYPEIVRAYHLGRYADPDDESLLHEHHSVYRVEENARWNFQPGEAARGVVATPHDAAFNPAPVNDAILAEVNSQKLASAQIVAQSRTLAASLAQFQFTLSQTRTNLQQVAALRSSLADFQRRLDALEAARTSSPFVSATNFSTASHPDSLTP